MSSKITTPDGMDHHLEMTITSDAPPTVTIRNADYVYTLDRLSHFTVQQVEADDAL